MVVVLTSFPVARQHPIQVTHPILTVLLLPVLHPDRCRVADAEG